jgi:ankyrin repeat protein
VDSNKSHNEFLLTAARHGDTTAITKALTAGADINTVDKNGMTPLMKAVLHKKASAVALLIAAKANVNIANNGHTALMFSADDANILNMLIDAGADINTAANKKETVLIFAVKYACTETIKILLSKPTIQVNAVDHEGNSALMHAPLFGKRCPEITQLLIKHPSINVNTINHMGETALSLAKSQKQTVLINILIKAGAKSVFKIKLENLKQKIGLTMKNLYTEFKKHPSYYLLSGATRLAIGALVGYGLSYGLTTLAAPYLAPAVQPFLANLHNVTVLPTITASNIMGGLTALLPKAIAAASILGGLFASTKLSNGLLVRFFGEIKISAKIVSEENKPEKENINITTKKVRGILEIFGQNRPYTTPVSEIADQLAQQLSLKNKDNADLLPQSTTFAQAFAYTREIVNAAKHNAIFDANAKAEVNAEPYVSAKCESVKKRA